ncbi:MAG: hypothetical protein ACFFCS_08925 [Candidatus Hodarchaeota archaeon]
MHFLNGLNRGFSHPVEVRQNFIVFHKDGRTFMIDLYDGELYAHPELPSDGFLKKLQNKQCNSCYYYRSPEAVMNCMHYLESGYLHPTRICVITDFHASKKMNDFVLANQALSNVSLSGTQLKILSMLISFQWNAIPFEIQQKISGIPDQKSLVKNKCPFFSDVLGMKRFLIQRNIARYERKRRFLDVLKTFKFLNPGFHTIGTAYWNNKIAHLESQLNKLRLTN